MNKNVVSVDLDELLKARQELDSERGVTTDPNMYKKYNPGRKNEKSEVSEDSQNQDDSASFDAEIVNDDEKISESDNNQTQNLDSSSENLKEKDSQINNNTEVDFSVYDNFASFEINSNSEMEENPKTLAENYNMPEVNVEPNIVSKQHTNEEQIHNEMPIIDVEPKFDSQVKDSQPEDESSATNNNLNAEAESLSDEIDKLVSMYTNNSSEENQSVENVENSDENDANDESSEVNLDDFAEFLGIDRNFLDNYTSNEEAVENDTEITANKEVESLKDSKSETNEDALIKPTEQNSIVEGNGEENLFENEKFIQNLNDSESFSEQKVKETKTNISVLKESPSLRVNGLKLIKDVDFLDIIGSNEFEGIEKLTYILGQNENQDTEFVKLQEMYNVAVFSKNEDNINKFFNSIILSLMLKHSKENLKFYLLDTDSSSIFDVYKDSSYLVAPVAKSKGEILTLLKVLIEEIDERYEKIASLEVKNIEEYNSVATKNSLIELPYNVLFFNNYINVSYIEDWKKINESLAYILKYGRLVGVYVYIRAYDEILDENINYSLASRVAFKADSEKYSYKQIGVSGAELLDENDEFMLKTIYSEKVNHLKVPNISNREIKLLIQNIEG